MPLLSPHLPGGSQRPPPPGFQGDWLKGSAAAEAASRISGPFRTRPFAYASPRDLEDLSRLVAYSREEGISLVPRGAGTGMPGGNLGPGIVVDLASSFSSIHPLQGHTLRVGAGAVAGTVDQEARNVGLHLPPLPSSARWCSIGGMAANNAAGARSFGHGPMASWVVGLEGLDAEGRPFRLGSAMGPGDDTLQDLPRGSGPFTSLEEALAPSLPWELAPDPGRRLPDWPRVRKNASGYALDRYGASRDPVQLLVGSEGTLALLTGVTLRLTPVPIQRGLHILPMDTPETVSAAALEARELGAVACEFLGRRFLEIAGLEQHPELGDLARGAWALLFLEFEGDRDDVEAGLAAARSLGRSLSGEGMGTLDPEQAQALWSVRHAASPVIAARASEGLLSTQFIEDSVVPPEELGRYLRGLEEILARNRFDAVIFGHAGDGNVHVNPLVDVGSADWLPRVRGTLEAVVELVAELGGTLSGEHGDGRLRAPFLERIWGDAALAAFRRVKEHFDPDGRLNPGVILPVEGQDPLEDLHPRPRSWPV
ncbi:MAG: FAD-binding oxidoreductase [Gemmatimonadales bacterium]|nr:MAG: FAD-binding oxidoreductase [Gemmatimonadales bacterium]